MKTELFFHSVILKCSTYFSNICFYLSVLGMSTTIQENQHESNGDMCHLDKLDGIHTIATMKLTTEQQNRIRKEMKQVITDGGYTVDEYVNDIIRTKSYAKVPYMAAMWKIFHLANWNTKYALIPEGCNDSHIETFLRKFYDENRSDVSRETVQ